MQEPGRRGGAQQGRNGAVVAAQLREGFENGMIRLARAVLLYALAAGASDVAEVRNEMLDQRGLADPGSPATQTTVRWPPHAPSQALRSRESASARPTKDGPGNERLSETFARADCVAGIAVATVMNR